jgi:hypothetical protein
LAVMKPRRSSDCRARHGSRHPKPMRSRR